MALPPENHCTDRKDQDQFRGARPLHLRGIEEVGEEDKDKDYDRNYFFDYNYVKGGVQLVYGVVPAVKPKEQRDLVERYKRALSEYKSGEVGDPDNECDNIWGDSPPEGNTQVKGALKLYLQ